MDVWLPGYGNVPINAVTAANAVTDYDADLMLGQNQATGEWQVFVRNGPHDGQPFPVFTLGKELPSYDEIQRKLYHADVRKHGHRIVEAVQRRVDANKRALDNQAHEYAEESAEEIEFHMRKGGMLPKLKIFVPSGKE